MPFDKAEYAVAASARMRSAKRKGSIDELREPRARENVQLIK